VRTTIDEEARMTDRSPAGASFPRDDILALLELDPNQAYTPLAQLCAALGLEPAAEERRARGNATLAAGLRALPLDDERGGRPVLCLRSDLVPLWLTGVDAGQVRPEARARLELFQREAASLLWQSFRPQGFGPEDALLPPRHEQSPAEAAYVTAVGIASLARHQMLVERHLSAVRSADDSQQAALNAAHARVDDPQAALLAQTVRRVALTLAERSRRNEYGGVYSGLYRQFGITSYRRMPPARLHEALEWLERWHGDLLGEPEPPPDI
jgi:hypothetical protein